MQEKAEEIAEHVVDHAGHAQVAYKHKQGCVTRDAAVTVPWPIFKLAQDVCCAARQKTHARLWLKDSRLYLASSKCVLCC